MNVKNYLYLGIPTLVILDKEGKIVNGSGRAAVSSDPDGLVIFNSLYTVGYHRFRFCRDDVDTHKRLAQNLCSSSFSYKHELAKPMIS